MTRDQLNIGARGGDDDWQQALAAAKSLAAPGWRADAALAKFNRSVASPSAAQTAAAAAIAADKVALGHPLRNLLDGLTFAKIALCGTLAVAATAGATFGVQHAQSTHNERSTPTTEPAASHATLPSASALPAPAKSVEAEIAFVVQLKRLLAVSPRQAIRFARAHDSQFRDGVLFEEREALMILALLRVQPDAPTRARARHFVQRFPQSTYAARIKQALAQ